MLAIALACFFIAIFLFAYTGIPYLFRRYTDIQNKRMEKANRYLDMHVFDIEAKKKLISRLSFIPLVLAAGGFIATRNIVGGVFGFAVGLIIPSIVIKSIPGQRQKKFHGQFVDALMLISSSLKAGLNLSQAFEIVAEEMPAPMGEEISLVVKENKMGMTFQECLLRLKQRIPLDDLALVVTAVIIAQETGGDLTEVFDELVTTISEKKKLEDKVRTLTVQGRLQGFIMSLLPVAFAIFVYFSNPHNFDIMFKHHVGQTLLIYAVFSELIGAYLIKKLSKVEI